MTPSPRNTVVARLLTDETTAKHLSGQMAEILPADEIAVSAFELDEAAKSWAIEFVFENAPNEAAFRSLIAEQAGEALAGTLVFETLQEKDWVAASLEGLAPVKAGRFVIHGSHDRTKVLPNRIGIEIEAALAFGTGHHGTTRGCLMAFNALAKRKLIRRVLDVGTGTGVLAIAAARLLHRPVLGSDIDPVAVRVARDNAARNRAGAYVSLFTAAGANAGRFKAAGKNDVIFANILAPPLKRMAHPLSQLLASHGRLILSGLLPSQGNAIIAAYRMQGLHLEASYRLEGWVTLVMRRGA